MLSKGLLLKRSASGTGRSAYWLERALPRVGLLQCLHLWPLYSSAAGWLWLKPRDLHNVKCFNTVQGNLETTMPGVSHALKYRKYAAHYLAGLLTGSTVASLRMA